MGLHRKGGKTVKKRSSRNNKKGGSFGALMSQLAAPVVLFSANHLYGNKTRRNNNKRNCKRCNKKSAKRSRRFLSRRRR
jgi:hypothetical protein